MGPKHNGYGRDCLPSVLGENTDWYLIDIDNLLDATINIIIQYLYKLVFPTI